MNKLTVLYGLAIALTLAVIVAVAVRPNDESTVPVGADATAVPAISSSENLREAEQNLKNMNPDEVEAQLNKEKINTEGFFNS